MTSTRKLEKYRSHDLVSAFFKDEYLGRVTKGKDLLFEVRGHDIDSNLEKLRAFVDERMAEMTSEEAPTPNVQAYVEAFRRLRGTFTPRHRAMLKAHFHAPLRTLTAAELAAAAPYSSSSAANLQYGLLGKALFEELPVCLPTRLDGTPLYTGALATTRASNGKEVLWRWTMRPEVAQALEALGLTA